MRRWRSDEGATMVEYSLMIAFVVIVAFLGVQIFGDAVLGLFDSAVDAAP
jgi:Flp pilus assembly pilin Flp